jgi:hypothetical protein
MTKQAVKRVSKRRAKLLASINDYVAHHCRNCEGHITGECNWTDVGMRNTLVVMLTDRLENYGYDWPNFRRISNQRSRARAKLHDLVLRYANLDWGSLSNRWHRKTGEYTVGQSVNEELTNEIRFLIGLKGWVS